MPAVHDDSMDELEVAKRVRNSVNLLVSEDVQEVDTYDFVCKALPLAFHFALEEALVCSLLVLIEVGLLLDLDYEHRLGGDADNADEEAEEAGEELLGHHVAIADGGHSDGHNPEGFLEVYLLVVWHELFEDLHVKGEAEEAGGYQH